MEAPQLELGDNETHAQPTWMDEIYKGSRIEDSGRYYHIWPWIGLGGPTWMDEIKTMPTWGMAATAFTASFTAGWWALSVSVACFNASLNL